MADQQNELPEGTDTIIEGASEPTNSPDITITGGADTEDTSDEVLIVAVTEEDTAPRGGRSTVADKLRSGRQQLSGQAADKARGLVGQGLERGSEALANVGRLVGDTAAGLDERLGAEYGDYARRAASAIESAASSIAAKDADELIDDTREFVRRSPGVALAGAAIVGFALARLVKSGLAGSDDGDDRGSRSRGPRA